jgi:hypothetical protein
MKKYLLSLLICALLMPSLAAYADVLFEPQNDFYEQHSRHILYLGRSFIVSSADGSAAVRNAPGERTSTGKIQSGEIIYLEFSCLYDGDFWGFAPRHDGWIKIEELLVLYDYIAFEEEHLNTLYRYEGDYGGIAETRSALVWAYPGADAPLYTLENLDMDSFRIAHAYMDEDEREWGFVAYLYGSRNSWVCLSEPLNRDLPAFNSPRAPEPWDSDTEHTNIPKTADSVLAIIVVLVAALVTGTTVLIKILWKPTGGKTDD